MPIEAPAVPAEKVVRPMKFAIVSDVHGNLEALTAVFERIGPDDGVLCLGDIVGYGPNPNECLALLRERATATVLGNHDVAAIDSHGLAYFNPNARAAIHWTQGVLDPDHVRWLDGLSYEVRTPEYLLVHGAPVEYFAYILDKAAAQRAHVADYYALAQDGALAHAFCQRGGRIDLEPGVRYLVNVGSVGQPRDLNPDASFVFYDPDARTIVWERVPYAVARTQEKIGAAHLPDALARRLTVGR
jgi:diadenosine tetraphosphatase ApaH/serine/threonine PP2A family protein phosphatase